MAAAAAAGQRAQQGFRLRPLKNLAAYAAVVTEVEVEELIRLPRVWCATDAGLVVNPDGAKNQLEGGLIQSASWVLKEEVRLDNARQRPARLGELSGAALLRGAGNRHRASRRRHRCPPLGVGEATAGPTVAAIGNAVSRALGVRFRDLPLTRERIMGKLLAQ